MSLLSDLLSVSPRRAVRVRPYLPFTEPRFPGPYPFRSAWRNANAISNAYLLAKAFSYGQTALPMRRPGLSLIQDRRRWSPNPVALDTSGRQVTPVDMPPSRRPFLFREPDWEKITKPPRRIDWRPRVSTQLANGPWWYGFANANKVVICLERKMRREVMHALGMAGRTGFKKPHYNEWSRVRC